MSNFPVLKLVPSHGQDTIGDCGICSIATICDKSYEDVVVAAVEQVGEEWKKGLYVKDIVKIAAKLGVILKRKYKFDMDIVCGILSCTVKTKVPNKRPKKEYHAVVLMDGKIYDWDLRVWDVDAFQSHYDAEFGILLEVQ